MDESIRVFFFLSVNATGSFELSQCRKSCTFLNFKTHQLLFLESRFTPNITSRDFSVGTSGCERESDRERTPECSWGGGVRFSLM